MRKATAIFIVIGLLFIAAPINGSEKEPSKTKPANNQQISDKAQPETELSEMNIFVKCPSLCRLPLMRGKLAPCTATVKIDLDEKTTVDNKIDTL